MKLAESQQLEQPHTSSPVTFSTQPHSSPATLLEEGPVVLVACLLGFPCSLSHLYRLASYHRDCLCATQGLASAVLSDPLMLTSWWLQIRYHLDSSQVLLTASPLWMQLCPPLCAEGTLSCDVTSQEMGDAIGFLLEVNLPLLKVEPLSGVVLPSRHSFDLPVQHKGLPCEISSARQIHPLSLCLTSVRFSE